MSEAAQAFAAWFYQMTGEAQPGQDQAAPESVAPSYPVVSDGGELANVTHEASAAEQFTEWFHRAI